MEMNPPGIHAAGLHRLVKSLVGFARVSEPKSTGQSKRVAIFKPQANFCCQSAVFIYFRPSYHPSCILPW